MVPKDQNKRNAQYHVTLLLLLNQHGDTSLSFVPECNANLQNSFDCRNYAAWHLLLRLPTLKCLLVIAGNSFCSRSAHPSMWHDNRLSHAVLFNRLAAENHSLKRNMGVYIAEAQRAKRILQHSRAAQGEGIVHDQHDVGSKYPQPPLLSQQRAQQECAEHVQPDRDYASGHTPGHSPSLQQQAHECRSLHHHSPSDVSKMADEPYNPADKDCSLGDVMNMMSQNAAGHRCQTSTSLLPAQLPGKSIEGTAMTDAGRPGNAAMVTPTPAAAEASFALPSFIGSIQVPLPAAQLSRPHSTIGGHAACDTHAWTDLHTDEQPHSHVGQWYESHHEREDSDVGLRQLDSCETAEHGNKCDHAAARSYQIHRKEASPVAAKFAFARCATTDVDHSLNAQHIFRCTNLPDKNRPNDTARAAK